MRLNFHLQTNTKIFYKLTVSLWVCKARHAQITQNNKFAISLQYLKKNVKDEDDLLSADKHKGFFNLILLFQVNVARHSQITQNNKFFIYLQYLKIELIDEVDFLHVDKHESFLQVDTIIFNRYDQAFPKFSNLQCLYNV